MWWQVDTGGSGVTRARLWPYHGHILDPCNSHFFTLASICAGQVPIKVVFCLIGCFIPHPPVFAEHGMASVWRGWGWLTQRFLPSFSVWQYPECGDWGDWCPQVMPLSSPRTMPQEAEVTDCKMKILCKAMMENKFLFHYLTTALGTLLKKIIFLASHISIGLGPSSSITFYDLLWPSMTFYDLYDLLHMIIYDYMSLIKPRSNVRWGPL